MTADPTRKGLPPQQEAALALLQALFDHQPKLDEI